MEENTNKTDPEDKDENEDEGSNATPEFIGLKAHLT